MNLTRNQIIAGILAVLSVLMVSTSQLTDLFGPAHTKLIVSTAGILNSMLAGILAAMSGQTTQIKDVQAMAGVDKIVVNKDANATLATLAVDPLQPKIEASASAEKAVVQTAKTAEKEK